MNTKPNKGSLKPGCKLPPRGQSKRTLILDALQESALLSLPKNATRDDVEKAFFARLAKAALDDNHKDSGLCKQALLDRGWAKLKPEAEAKEFTYDAKATPAENAANFMQSASSGLISIEDLGKLLAGIKDTLTIHESTELAKRLEALESAVNGGSK